MPRSGTNFLADLLTIHPQCALPKPIWEDYVLRHAQLLEEYGRCTARHWNPGWGVSEAEETELLRSLGDGILDFLQRRIPAERRLVTKTPSVHNLDRIPRLFPEAHVLVIVRDGRAVVESGRRTFGWEYDRATRRWRDAAREIQRFEASVGPDLRYRRVRYEDLHRNVEEELRGLLNFLGLDPGRYDFGRAIDLPVKGSSELAAGSGEVHWSPVERPEEFQPLRRWHDWERARHERFNWIAGPELQAFGYEPVEGDGATRWRLWNLEKDLRHRTSRAVRATGRDIRRLARAVRRRLGER